MSKYRSLVGFNPIMTDVLSQGLLRIHLSLNLCRALQNDNIGVILLCAISP